MNKEHVTSGLGLRALTVPINTCAYSRDGHGKRLLFKSTPQAYSHNVRILFPNILNCFLGSEWEIV